MGDSSASKMISLFHENKSLGLPGFLDHRDRSTPRYMYRYRQGRIKNGKTIENFVGRYNTQNYLFYFDFCMILLILADNCDLQKKKKKKGFMKRHLVRFPYTYIAHTYKLLFDVYARGIPNHYDPLRAPSRRTTTSISGDE